MQQGTPEWLEWRKKGIGASEAAAILGLCPYSTPYKVWLDKTGRAKAFEGNFATQRGSELEGKARALYELINMDDMPPAIAVHPKYEILRASLDGLSSDGKLILEIKVPSQATHDMAKNGVVPDHYMVQIQQQLLVTGADKCHFFTYSEKDDSHALVEVLPDLTIQGKIVSAAIHFWNKHVLADVAPELTTRDEKVLIDVYSLQIADELATSTNLTEDDKNIMKRKLIDIGKHNKVRCGPVLVSKSITKTGKDSYRLTIAKPNEVTQ